MFYVLCEKRGLPTDMEVGNPFIGLEMPSRTPCFAVEGQSIQKENRQNDSDELKSSCETVEAPTDPAEFNGEV